MKIGAITRVAFLITTGLILAAQSQPDYLCTISRVESAFESKNDAVLAAIRETKIGATFSVNRQSGLMSGALRNSFATKPIVIDVGSKDNSYKVVTTMKRSEGAGFGTAVFVLVIKEWEEGPKKPFVFFDGDYVFTGYAIHFK